MTPFVGMLFAAGAALALQATAPLPQARRHFESVREGCFLLKDLRTDAVESFNPERCSRPFSPCSTFKIPNALIGLETGVLTGPDHLMTWDGTRSEREVTNRDHTLRSAMEHSVVWYFQRVASGIGKERMRRHLATIGYGNQDLSGGLTRFWLGSSLAISAEEQLAFMERLAEGDLPFSSGALDAVRTILVLRSDGGAVLRGKTGSGRGDPDDLGWFVGYLTNPDGAWAFACNVSGRGAFGTRARSIVEAVLEERGLLPRAAGPSEAREGPTGEPAPR
ncbi:MAG TPA: penicillin-binding transpeptidase domain-containing protein [Candidatus Polarisedimenticolia bacterium]|nr:penicillin-binding transpeptidase domain-containing protein [Candidatus Polarisedimenticolia bacterium]